MGGGGRPLLLQLGSGGGGDERGTDDVAGGRTCIRDKRYGRGQANSSVGTSSTFQVM